MCQGQLGITSSLLRRRAPSVPGPCTPYTSKLSNSTYLLNTLPADAVTAEQSCIRQGGHLASFSRYGSESALVEFWVGEVELVQLVPSCKGHSFVTATSVLHLMPPSAPCSAEEQFEVEQHFINVAGCLLASFHTAYWVGLQQTDPSSGFAWLDQSPPDEYTHWCGAAGLVSLACIAAGMHCGTRC